MECSTDFVVLFDLPRQAPLLEPIDDGRPPAGESTLIEYVVVTTTSYA